MATNKKDNPYYNPKVQKILNKLISDEKMASEFYKDFVLRVAPEYRPYVKEAFLDIAKDEFEDHYLGLIQFCEDFGYDIPVGYSEISKYAGDISIKLFNKSKDGQDPKYYVELAIESETESIKDYEKAISDLEKEKLEYGNLRGILLSNYYDELEHLSTLQFLMQNLNMEFGEEVLDLNIQ